MSGYINDEFSDRFRQITHSNPLPQPKDDGITYAIDTRKGQSGGPVYIKDDENVKLIGIHKAFSTKDKLNIGVLITGEIIAFLRRWASEMNTSLQILPLKDKKLDK